MRASRTCIERDGVRVHYVYGVTQCGAVCAIALGDVGSIDKGRPLKILQGVTRGYTSVTSAAVLIPSKH